MPRIQVTSEVLHQVLLEAVKHHPRSVKALSADLGIGYERTKVALEALVEKKILVIVDELLENRKLNKVFYERGSEPGAQQRSARIALSILRGFQDHAAALLAQGVRY